MRRIRRGLRHLVAPVRGFIEPLAPERAVDGKLTPDGQREAVVLYGLVLVAGAFLAAGSLALALFVPGLALFAIGLGLDLRRRP